MKIAKIASLLSVACISLSAYATTTTHICKNGSVQRRLEVNIDEANKLAGCTVKYFKDTEAPGTETVIFKADAHSPMCQERAEAFINKLASWGYPCTPGLAASSVEPTTAPAAKPMTAPATETVAPQKKAATGKKPVPAGKSEVISDD